ncbi:MAG: hypothetical protein COZ89_01395 [Candidatus Nealsonbacteria bacterium CG_4_8_14_3_um_filter_37_23]|nr:MAG: hypothetical protein COZ89_01395 [Candidatus Nealsonbacteria bacterium CG_4_8_14_3_um_filter_37_23]
MTAVWIILLILGLVGIGITIHYGKKFRDERKKGVALAFLLSLIITIGVWAGFLWIFRPAFHWLWFNVFYMNPTFWIFTGVIAGVTALIYWLRRNIRKPRRVKTYWKEYTTTERMTGRYLKVGIGTWVGWIIAFSVLMGPFTATGPINLVKIYNEIKPATTIIETLPETSEIRYLPMEVAEAISRMQIGTSTRTVGDFDPVLDKEGRMVWSTPLVPSGGIRKLTRQMEGMALLKSDGTIESSDAFFKYGEGMAILDNVIWKLREHKYFVDYCETFCWFDGNTPIIVAPYLEYEYKFPVRVPRWGGVCIVYPNGTIKDFTPKEARDLPFLQGQRLLPEKLAKLFVESWAYQYGIVNKWWLHEDQIMIPKVADSKNQMPYLMPIGRENEPKWVTTTEPFGEAFGLSKIFFVDAREEKMEIYEPVKYDREKQKYEIRQTLIGPNKAWEYGKGAPGIAEYKWIETVTEKEGVKESAGTWRLLEPRPTFLEGRMNWMLTVASSECTVIQHTVLVDAEAARAKENRFVFNTEAELRKYLKTGILETAPKEITPLKGISPEAISQLEKLNQMYQEFQQKWQGEWQKLIKLLEEEK